MDRRFFIRRASALPVLAALAGIGVKVSEGATQSSGIAVSDTAVAQPERIPTLERILNWAAGASVGVTCPSCPSRVFGGFAPYQFKAAVTFVPHYDYQSEETGFDVQVHALPSASGHFGDNHLTSQERVWVEAKAHDDLRQQLATLIQQITEE